MVVESLPKTAILKPSRIGRLSDVVILAVTYVATARLSQVLAIEPGNVTPVWIPSGIMLAAVLWRGYHVWPGVWLGAFVGNAWAYFDTNSWSAIGATLFAGSMNGLGDVLSAIGGAYLIRRTTGTRLPLDSAGNMAKFITFGAVLGPAASAVFGITALCLATSFWSVDFLGWNAYAIAWLTWWTGDGVGVLVFAPALLVFAGQETRSPHAASRLEGAAFVGALLAINVLCLGILPECLTAHAPLAMNTPILIWGVFRLGPRVVFPSLILLLEVTIFAALTGYGHFVSQELNYLLIELQFFLAVGTVTTLMLCGTVAERRRSAEHLRRLNATLEQRVARRTVLLETQLADRKSIERQLRESQYRCDLAVQGSSAGLWDWPDVTRDEMWWSPRWYELLGYDDGEIEARRSVFFQFVVHPDDIDAAEDAMQVHLQQGTPYNVELRVKTKVGEYRWIRALAQATWGENGKPTRISGSIQDIHEQKLAEEALVESQRRYQAIFEQTEDSIILFDAQTGALVDFNDRAHKNLGYTREEFGKLAVADVDVNDTAEDVRRRCQYLVEHGEGRFETQHRCKDGAIRDMRVVVRPVALQGRSLLLGTYRDVTEAKRSEAIESLTRRCLETVNSQSTPRPLLQEIVENIQEFTGCTAVGIRLLDDEGNVPYEAYCGFPQQFYELESPLSIKHDHCMCIDVIQGFAREDHPFVTPAGSFYMNGTTRFLATVSEEEKGATRNQCNKHGYESVALIPLRLGNQTLGLIHLADFRDDMVPLDVVTPLEKLGTQLSAAIQRVRAEGELRQAKAELENRVTERTLELIRKNDRLHREMEERKQVEQELAKAQHLASLGTLAAGIAHEINNPLHAIAMSAEVTGQALMMPGNEQTAKTFLQKIKDEVARCGRIVRSVLQFARQESSDKWPHQLDKVVNQAVGLVQQQAAERNISVQAELPDRLPLLTMNPTEMEQVLVNLLSNAIMASPPHDHVSVTAEAAADTVCLIVRDKGRGMTEEELQHIFDPFFTTRQQSGGTGLGLSIVHGIVEDHGGTIRVESAFNVGTSFVIELPSTSASEQTDAPHDMPRCPTRSRRQAATQFDPDDTTCS